MTRVLLVEDEFFVALALEQELQAAGFETTGPYNTLATATSASRQEAFDIALLDVNVNGEFVYPLADELHERALPFILLSGYSERDLPERFRSLPRLGKPFDYAMVISRIREMVGNAT